ncbi:kinase with adenine nucleotide alpha hydrolases-like domain-containing protein [Actinidia rufa]|uniref:Kinase with adenine nucleotide alpha hydrolases-like domain-containing protein n=1 Tax=Actinidia rufa TaxID=165716 RepID=A0A7J0EIW1_9ERIC|nr:kinase with adenine nucleotide alpha hydrolases-like domain-containing protein [Actinidia rufa]
MTPNALAGEGREMENSGGRTVVVGVKLDSHSRELLTWALVKISQPGDRVIALHVLGNNEIVDRDGKSSLLSLVKAFDSVLAVYEGFCNLKQELLKITSRSVHRFLLPSTVQRNLPKDCSILAVDNGKVVFQREASPMTNGRAKESATKKKCSICSPGSVLPENSCVQSTNAPNDCDKDNSKALVPVRKLEAASSSVFPLLDRQASERPSAQQISVVQWAMQLPTRNCLPSADSKQSTCREGENQSSEPDRESGAIVPVGAERLHLLQIVQVPGTSASSTSNFKPENLIGKGGSSKVYRGCLPDGKELAVKILKPSEDVLKEFVLEIEIIITAVHHERTLFLFLGSVLRTAIFNLVYDFLSRGSLEENLHRDEKDAHVFGWNERYKVARRCVAEGTGISTQFKVYLRLHIGFYFLSTHAVLVGFQLSDFGLAKWASTSSQPIICTDVAGTFGKPISNDHPKGQESLVMWAKPILNGGKFTQLLDSSLGNTYDQYQMENMVLAASLCIRRAPRARPPMSIILKLLQGDSDVITWARLQVHDSEGPDMLDNETFSRSDLQSHLNIALLGVDEDSLSTSSIEQSVSLEDYLQGRWSRSSSFD